MKPAVVDLAKVPELGPKLLRSSSNEVAGFILTVLHSLTYLPLVLLPIMQDAHLKLVVVLNTTLCLCLMAGSVLFHFLGIVKVRWLHQFLTLTLPAGSLVTGVLTDVMFADHHVLLTHGVSSCTAGLS